MQRKPAVKTTEEEEKEEEETNIVNALSLQTEQFLKGLAET